MAYFEALFSVFVEVLEESRQEISATISDLRAEI
jgi:hypothetical protein